MTDMIEHKKTYYISRMIQYMPTLRTAMGITQKDLSRRLDVSRQTIVALETGKRDMTWTMYLALACVFAQDETATVLLKNLDVFPYHLD